VSASDLMYDRLWRASESLIEATASWPRAKQYILALLFLRFLSHWKEETLAAHRRRYRSDEMRIQRAMNRERFLLPDDCSFQHLLEQSTAADLDKTINAALEAIENANTHKLAGVFSNADFNSAELGSTAERTARIRLLLRTLAEIDIDSSEQIGALAKILISHFAEESARHREAYQTPHDVAQLMIRLVNPGPGERIYDPACGAGDLLIHAARAIDNRDFALFGHERHQPTWALCRLNLAFQNMDAAHIVHGDPMRTPMLTANDELRKFQVVISDPPFASTEWDIDSVQPDRFNRFKRGIPPRTSGDYAFITHLVESIDVDGGRACTAAPLGTLFRGGSEGLIRRRLIEDGLLEGVIRLPANLFFGTSMPAALLFFSTGTGRRQRSVFFIDASRDFEVDKNRNRLRPEDIEKILDTWRHRKEEPRYSRFAGFEEIQSNDFNLNVSLYIEPHIRETNLSDVRFDIERLERELSETRAKLSAALNRLSQ
jgi:type I restriction enzyme M protein